MRVLLLVTVTNLSILGCSGVPPRHLGLKEGRLIPCPSTPNCVSSQSTDPRHAVAPLPLRSAGYDAVLQLKKIVIEMPRTRIVEEQGLYLRAEFRSALFRFVDDVEFFPDETAGIIHVRSASRVGRSDFGVNRERIEEIRIRWDAISK